MAIAYFGATDGRFAGAPECRTHLDREKEVGREQAGYGVLFASHPHFKQERTGRIPAALECRMKKEPRTVTGRLGDWETGRLGGLGDVFKSWR
jgi:hypothetical protein